MSQSPPNDHQGDRASTPKPIDIETANAIIGRIAPELPKPQGPSKPLPDDRELLHRLLAETERFIGFCEAYLADHYRLSCGVHADHQAELRETQARIIQAVPPLMDLSLDYFPISSAALLLQAAFILMTKPDSEYPDVKEIVADRGLVAAISWFMDHARNVRSQVFRKLADGRGEQERTNANGSDELGWIVGSRGKLNLALGMNRTYPDYLERCQEAGELDFERREKKFAIRLKDPKRHREVEERFKSLVGVK